MHRLAASCRQPRPLDARLTLETILDQSSPVPGRVRVERFVVAAIAGAFIGLAVLRYSGFVGLLATAAGLAFARRPNS